MSNFVHIGRVAAHRADVVVGVRADLGEVVVSIDGRNQPLPPLTPDNAKALAGHLERGAGVAKTLSDAYQTYQQQLKAAEDALTQAFSREVGA
ncbi:hypothetical protein SEA_TRIBLETROUBLE_58 [Mycobacterium Phage TribleTrouble]|nr:hypothetical protein SEA_TRIBLETROUBLE_58 [Mycobacterium Phage TribleTrouble]